MNDPVTFWQLVITCIVILFAMAIATFQLSNHIFEKFWKLQKIIDGIQHILTSEREVVEKAVNDAHERFEKDIQKIEDANRRWDNIEIDSSDIRKTSEKFYQCIVETDFRFAKHPPFEYNTFKIYNDFTNNFFFSNSKDAWLKYFWDLKKLARFHLQLEEENAWIAYYKSQTNLSNTHYADYRSVKSLLNHRRLAKDLTLQIMTLEREIFEIINRPYKKN